MRSAPVPRRRSLATRASPASRSRRSASKNPPGMPPCPPRTRGRGALRVRVSGSRPRAPRWREHHAQPRNRHLSPDVHPQFLQGSMNQHLTPPAVPFIDVASQRSRLGKSIDDAVSRVLDHCQFINGPEVTQLEAQLADFSGARHVVTCASGTDALLMVLMARGVGPGDAVLCPSFTFCATGEVVALLGATPLFVDVDETTFNIDVESLQRGIATARRLGLKPVAVIPVDLFGQSADQDAIGAVAA